MNTTAVTLSTGTLENTDLDTTLENILATDTPWKVIVWNDPVNLMTYVSYVFRSHFGYSRARAEELMLQVHNNGKAIPLTGPRPAPAPHTPPPARLLTVNFDNSRFTAPVSCFQLAFPPHIALATDQLSQGGLAIIKSGLGNLSSSSNSLLSPNIRL